MATKVLHVSDSVIDSTHSTEDGATGSLPAVITQAIRRDVDAVLHTGNLFATPTPTDEDITTAVDTLSELSQHGIEFYIVAGEHEALSDSDPLSQLEAVDGVTRLDTTPTLVDETVALYGIDHVETETELTEAVSQLEPTSGMTYSVLALHQAIWPPSSKDNAVMGALELGDATDVFISEIAAGGRIHRANWEYDKYDFSVTYAGSTNPSVTDAETEPTASLLTVHDYETASRETIPIHPPDIDRELATLQAVCKYDPAALEDLETETLVDLYGLTSKARSVLESRRKELRDHVTDRIPKGSAANGEYATIHNVVQTRRRLKDSDTVLNAVRAAGLDPQDTMEVSSTKIRELVEKGVLDEAAVFDEEERTQIQRGDVTLSE